MAPIFCPLLLRQQTQIAMIIAHHLHPAPLGWLRTVAKAQSRFTAPSRLFPYDRRIWLKKVRLWFCIHKYVVTVLDKFLFTALCVSLSVKIFKNSSQQAISSPAVFRNIQSDTYITIKVIDDDKFKLIFRENYGIFILWLGLAISSSSFLTRVRK